MAWVVLPEKPLPGVLPLPSGSVRTVRCEAAVKRNDALIHAVTGMNLDNTRLRE